MSTRGCVAIGTPEGWRGVYNHWDSYPTGLGKDVWDHLHALLKEGKTLEDFACELLSYDDWRAYLNRGVCEYCGQKTSQPHSISGVIAFRSNGRFETKSDMRDYYRSLSAYRSREVDIARIVCLEWRIRRNIERTGYPDPDAKYHGHDSRSPAEAQITADFPDPLYIEWVYITDPKTGVFHVLAHEGVPNPTRRPHADWCRPNGPGRWDYGHCVFWHTLVGSFPVSGDEPDWAALEAKGG